MHLKIPVVRWKHATAPTRRDRRWRMDLLQYRKIIIYALTFMAYAWSGYGAGLLSNLRDAVLTAESVFHDLFQNVITVAWKIKDIHEVFDAAVEEHCLFQCPDGNDIQSASIRIGAHRCALSGYLGVIIARIASARRRPRFSTIAPSAPWPFSSVAFRT